MGGKFGLEFLTILGFDLFIVSRNSAPNVAIYVYNKNSGHSWLT